MLLKHAQKGGKVYIMDNLNNFINIEFSYNGDLGRLQQKTIDNKIFCGRLLQNKIISHEEWQESMQLIQNYFDKQIQNVVENPLFFVDTI